MLNKMADVIYNTPIHYDNSFLTGHSATRIV